MKAVILVFSFLLLVQISTQTSVTPRITNGQNASPRQFVFMASIQFSYLKMFRYIHLCCGVAIDKYWILSTGVCVRATKSAGSFRVKINMYFTAKKDENVRTFSIEAKIVHELFEAELRNNNVGLLKLKKPINDPVLAKLPQPGNRVPNSLIMVGWGLGAGNVQPEVLQYASVDVMIPHRCQGLPEPMDGSMICTRSRQQRITACDGDTGGPLIWYADEDPVVEGIISWTPKPCGELGAPTISMKVLDYVPWINRKMEESVIPGRTDSTTGRIQSAVGDLLAPLGRFRKGCLDCLQDVNCSCCVEFVDACDFTECCKGDDDCCKGSSGWGTDK